MHRLLKRQIKKYLSRELIDSGQLDDFLDAINRAYKNFDSDNLQLERTLEISAQESFKELSDLKKAISITSMVMITDHHGKIIFVNHNLCNASGYSKEELIGQSYEKLNSKFHSPEFYNEIRETILGGNIWKGEVKEISKTGTTYWVDTTIVPLLNSVGKVYKFITIKIDITKIKKAEEQSEKSLAMAEKALEIKAEFLSNMSHEIRTPMNAIMGLSDIILQQPLEHSVRDNLKSIKQSADNLLVIINDILDFSKIEAGKVKIENISFNFLYQLEHIHKTMAFKAEQKNLKFKIIYPENTPKYLMGDPFRLNQVILNLCSNAIKFTQEGSVLIEIEILELTKDKSKILFSVIDTGIGIPEERQNQIFESFTQADVNVTRQFGGTGLGLTITKQLIGLMGGQIRVESKPGKGSRFYFTLEFELSNQDYSQIQTEELQEKSLEGLNILVMEDNLINQKVISQTLKNWGCTFSIVENGFKGLNLLQNNFYNIILMDLQMPQLDGFETTQEIRNGGAGINNLRIPIIALTADAFPETRDKVLEIGMNDLVSKPFKRNELNSKLYKMALEFCPEDLKSMH
jgi:PAS domain S-box-containing protein